MGFFPKVASFFTNLQGELEAKQIQALNKKGKCGWLAMKTISFFKRRKRKE
jgi:hypothetical protein